MEKDPKFSVAEKKSCEGYPHFNHIVLRARFLGNLQHRSTQIIYGVGAFDTESVYVQLNHTH